MFIFDIKLLSNMLIIHRSTYLAPLNFVLTAYEGSPEDPKERGTLSFSMIKENVVTERFPF